MKVIFLYLVIGVVFIGIVMFLLVGLMKVINEGMMSFLVGFEYLNLFVFGVIVGCMCVFDMGGLINKVVYVIGIVFLV